MTRRTATPVPLILFSALPRRVLILALALACLSPPGIATATTRHVPAQYATVQEAINVSTEGDTVLVAPGTYVENLLFLGLNLTLTSRFIDTGDPADIAATILDGGGTGTVVTFQFGETSTSQLVGFTIQNGAAPLGAGIHCTDSSPTIRDNAIRDNHGTGIDDGRGGGIYCGLTADPTISGNTISENIAGAGGGLYCDDQSHPTISNNVVVENSALDGGGILCFRSHCTIVNNTMSRNDAGYYGGAIYCIYSHPTIKNTICWDNTAPDGAEIRTYSSSPQVTYCDVQGGRSGTGNINEDPLFCAPDDASYRLDELSPCIGAGENGTDIGAPGVGCGVTGIHQAAPTGPAETSLHQNAPNPFNPRTTIHFTLGAPGPVTLVMYDVRGHEVATLVRGTRSAGPHRVEVDAGGMASGVYYYRLDTGTVSATRRMTLLK